MLTYHQLWVAIFLARVSTLCGAQESTLTGLDFFNAKLLLDFASTNADPITKGMFEGDINLNGRKIEKYTIDPTGRRKSPLRHWPKGQIPYTVSSQLSTYERSRIAAAIEEYKEKTCIRFVPRSKQRDYAFFSKDGGCYSMVGKAGAGRQVISIGDGCMSKGLIMHEIMHLLGFFHEQSRTDRDRYIRIKYDSMLPKSKSQFRKYHFGTVAQFGTKYDYGSILHYSSYAFSKNRMPTIETKQRGVIIGQRDRLSPTDILKINKLYRCPGSGGRGVIITTPGPTPHTLTRQTTASVSRTSPPASCNDKRPDCYWWRNSCVSTYINSVCRKTCDTCTGVGRGRVSKCTTSTAPSADCRDNRPDCYWWRHSCLSDYFKGVCKKTCKVCDNTGGGGGRKCTTACGDKRPDCYSWRNSCLSDYVKSVCMNTCKLCTTTSGRMSKCKDSTKFRKFCSGFKAKNYCSQGGISGLFMKSNCCATCGF